MALQYRLGIPVFQKDGICPACGAASDREGDHAIACGWEGERIARHNQLRDALFQTACQAALGPRKEEQALLPGLGNKPADVYIPNWIEGKDAALDVTVVSPLQATLIHKAAEEGGHALKHAYERKFRQVGQECEAQGLKFCPLPVETLGGWHPKAITLLSKLAHQLARQTGGDESLTTSHLYQRLGILLTKGNTALILSRSLDFSPQEIDGVVDS